MVHWPFLINGHVHSQTLTWATPCNTKDRNTGIVDQLRGDTCDTHRGLFLQHPVNPPKDHHRGAGMFWPITARETHYVYIAAWRLCSQGSAAHQCKSCKMLAESAPACKLDCCNEALLHTTDLLHVNVHSCEHCDQEILRRVSGCYQR
eukprot:CAMPEP_0172865376 /NCGR_PEP_ID=MMETSP1075-20121228/81371_1 /TAXON_ID=2916 /ORGANISM="Ceratium fusus, Strain PA161109" /LENGTH=147 /DNA_ID=CAMNT_0013714403 /DNA_START=904 /DNA_END=1347 /DNA_ORIENTATION=-